MSHAVQPITLRQAFVFVINAELTNKKVSARVLATLEDRIMKLAGPRRNALVPKMQQVVIDCVVQLTGSINAVCNEAIGQTKGITIMLTQSDYLVLVNSDPTVKNYASTPAGGIYSYLLDQFISGSVTWVNFNVVYAAATTRITRMLDISDKLDTVIGLQLNDHQQSYDQCVLTITAVRQRVATLSGENILGPLLGPLTTYCNGVLDGQQAIINLCTPDKVAARCGALQFGFVNLDADVQLLSGVTWPLHLTCQGVLSNCVGLRNIIQPIVFDGLRKILATSKQQKGFKLLLIALDGPGFLALSGLSTAETGLLCDRWLDVENEFLKKCPSGSSEEEILPFYLLACKGKSATEACFEIMRGTTPRIDLPPGHTSLGWMSVNGILMPAAFTTNGFSTDQACMKHCKQELGTAPSKVKIQAYFAELAQACYEAVQAWKANGRQDMDPITVICNGTTWHIVVGSNNNPVVHHIDSGYQNSPWINH